MIYIIVEYGVISHATFKICYSDIHEPHEYPLDGSLQNNTTFCAEDVGLPTSPTTLVVAQTCCPLEAKDGLFHHDTKLLGYKLQLP